MDKKKSVYIILGNSSKVMKKVLHATFILALQRIDAKKTVLDIYKRYCTAHYHSLLEFVFAANRNALHLPILGVNFINVLRVCFLYKIFGAKISNPKHSFVIFGKKISYEKRYCKMLMKLNLGIKSFFANINQTVST